MSRYVRKTTSGLRQAKNRLSYMGRRVMGVVRMFESSFMWEEILNEAYRIINNKQRHRTPPYAR